MQQANSGQEVESQLSYEACKKDKNDGLAEQSHHWSDKVAEELEGGSSSITIVTPSGETQLPLTMV